MPRGAEVAKLKGVEVVDMLGTSRSGQVGIRHSAWRSGAKGKIHNSKLQTPNSWGENSVVPQMRVIYAPWVDAGDKPQVKVNYPH